MGGYLGNDIDDIDDNVATLYEGASDQWYGVCEGGAKSGDFLKCSHLGLKRYFLNNDHQLVFTSLFIYTIDWIFLTNKTFLWQRHCFISRIKNKMKAIH